MVALAVSGWADPGARADAFPGVLASRYMDTTDAAYHYDLGCAIGRARLQGNPPHDGLVILDYGMARAQGGRYGASAFGGSGGFASTAEVRSAVVQFAHGFWLCTGLNVTAHLRIAVGTSNYGIGDLSTPDITAHGLAWAGMVNSINQDLLGLGYNQQVDVAGASDIETSWSTAAKARRWVDGYDVANAWPMYDYGDAGGCPTSGAAAAPAGCGSWTQEDVYDVAWGNPAAFAVPEIYLVDGTNARQWQQVSKFAALSGRSRIYFSGTLTQHAACAANARCAGGSTDTLPADGWQQLEGRCNRDVDTSLDVLWFATDMRWN